MIRVAFPLCADIAVNIKYPSETYEVIEIEKREGGKYMYLKNLHTGEMLTGFEIGILNSGFVFYRKDNRPALV